MNVLFVARNIPVPGIEENDIILEVARRLVTRGMKVEVVFPAEWLPVPRFLLRGRAKALASLPDRFEMRGIPVVTWRYLRLPTERWSYLLARFRLGGGNWSFAPDVIHAHYALPDGEIARTIAGKTGKRYLVTARQGDWRKLSQLPEGGALRRMALRVLRGAAGVFSPSKVVADRFAEWGIDMQVLPHGVEPSPVGVGIDPVAGPIVVAVAARLSAGKQVDWVIRAVAELSGVRPIELRVMGGGPEEAALRALARELGVNAKFTGQVPKAQVLRNLRESHIFALPSVSETFGLAYVEAAMSGCAVIATRGTGVDELFADPEEMRFQNGRYEHFVKCLRSLVEDDAARVSMAWRGHERVLRDYLWDAVLRRYEAVYVAADLATQPA
jgi:glycosyltransferase involved in cell wall biosynthesis